MMMMHSISRWAGCLNFEIPTWSGNDLQHPTLMFLASMHWMCTSDARVGSQNAFCAKVGFPFFLRRLFPHPDPAPWPHGAPGPPGALFGPQARYVAPYGENESLPKGSFNVEQGTAAATRLPKSIIWQPEKWFPGRLVPHRGPL